MNVVFFGASKYVLPILNQVQQHYDLKLIVTTEKPDPKLPQTAWEKVAPVMHFATTHNIPYLQVEKITDEIISKIKAVEAPVGILAYFGILVKQPVLDIFPKGIINVHPSLLPLYRGTTPGQTAILNGDQETGVTIMKLDEKMDHGPLLAQKKVSLLADENADTLYDRLFSLGSSLLINTLPPYLAGTLQPTPQDHTKATVTKILSKGDGYIVFDCAPTPTMLDRMIRAYYPWPGVYGKILINDKEVRIKFLPGKKVQPEGKKPMSYKDFINGYSEGKTILESLELI